MYKKTVLSNKLRVISYAMPQRDSIGVGIWIGAGGRYETDKNKGAAHFLEHILFKGTRHYSCDETKRLIEGVGGSLNAFTAEEYTCYFAKIPSQYLPKTFDVLADMVLYPLISKKDVDHERGVILEEIKMYHDQPQHFVLELLDELLWPGHPLGKNLAGSFESISRMTEEDLRQFHQGHYFPENIVVSAAGHLNNRQLVELTEKKFSRAPKKDKINFLKASNAQDKSRVRFFRKDIEQMHLALGMHSIHADHPDKHALNLLHIILGGNMSSRLFDEVREKRGLAYAISTSAKSLKDTGLFMVRAGIDNKKIVDALGVILDELKKISRENVTKNEFTRAKDYYTGQILLSLEDTLDHMFWIGEPTIALDKTRTLAHILKEVKKIGMADIRRVAGNIFKDNAMNLALVGPLTGEQETALSRLMGV